MMVSGLIFGHPLALSAPSLDFESFEVAGAGFAGGGWVRLHSSGRRRGLSCPHWGLCRPTSFAYSTRQLLCWPWLAFGVLWDSLGGRLHRRILVPPSGVSSVPPAAGCLAGFKQLRTLVDVLPLWVAPLVRLLLLDLFYHVGER